MHSSLLLDLLKLLVAESTKANQQRIEVIKEFIEDAARRSPDRAVELATAGTNLFEALHAAYDEQSRLQQHATEGVLSGVEIRRLANGLLGDTAAGPLEILSAASFAGHYSGYGSLRNRIHAAKSKFIDVLVSIEPNDQEPDWKEPVSV